MFLIISISFSVDIPTFNYSKLQFPKPFLNCKKEGVENWSRSHYWWYIWKKIGDMRDRKHLRMHFFQFGLNSLKGVRGGCPNLKKLLWPAIIHAKWTAITVAMEGIMAGYNACHIIIVYIYNVDYFVVSNNHIFHFMYMLIIMFHYNKEMHYINY